LCHFFNGKWKAEKNINKALGKLDLMAMTLHYNNIDICGEIILNKTDLSRIC
jgi:hypothetical protein